MKGYGETILEAWNAYGSQAKELLGGDPILTEDKNRMWRVTGSAAMHFVERHDPNEVPGPSLDDVAEAWQLALKEATGVDHELAPI
jgi:hypothetical protein